MDIFEITGYQTGISKAGVNFLQPKDSFQNISNGFIYREVLQSRRGVSLFAPRLIGNTRIMGIFEHIKPNGDTVLLAADKNFLYKYNTGTGIFDQIAFAGSMAAYGGFAITDNDQYISGVSYSMAPLLSTGAANPEFGTDGERFIFCGEGIAANANGSSIFFYNGTDVRDFTNIVDNPNFAQYIGGNLTSAAFVEYFNERLNFLIPVISNQPQEQSLLYSAIKTTNGNGDKFNIVTSGIFNVSTSEPITGKSILGDILIVNFLRSTRSFEVTTDKFNPYFLRKIPSELGCNAKFSPVAWSEKLNYLGKTGVLITDGRVQLRKDNKVPEFTADEIDQELFNLTYGGFDRTNEQILWSYKVSESDSVTQNSVLVKNYEEDSWSVYDLRFSVFGQTSLGINFNWENIEAANDASWETWDSTEEIWNKIGLGIAVQKTLAGDDLGFIYELNTDLDDIAVSISAIVPGATTTLTVSESAFLAGDLVTVENVLGMTQLNNYDNALPNLDYEPWEVLTATPTTIVLNVDSTLFGAYTPNTGRLSKVITFKAETIPFNPYRAEGCAVYISNVEFLIDINGGNLKVDIYANEEESPFKSNIIAYPNQDSPKAREWVSVSVNNEAEFFTFVMSQQSPSTQLILTSMRIQARRGVQTSQ